MRDEDFTEVFQNDDRVDFEKGYISLRWYTGDVDCVCKDNGYVFEPELTKRSPTSSPKSFDFLPHRQILRATL